MEHSENKMLYLGAAEGFLGKKGVLKRTKK